MRVQLGCGHKPWAGWINVDGERASQYADVVADLRTLPFADESVDAMIAVHVLEHFYEWEAVDVLKEWRRVLRPGAALILELPCMDKVFTYMAECAKRQCQPNVQMSYWALWGDPKYGRVEMTHKWGYSMAMLQEKVLEAGFAKVTFKQPRYHLPQRDMRAAAIR